MCPIIGIQSVTELPSERVAIMAAVQVNAPPQSNGSEGVSAVDLEMDKAQAASLFEKLGAVLNRHT